MRFKALCTRHEAIQALLSALKAASKLTSNIIIRCSPTTIHLIADPAYQDKGPLLSRCELICGDIFSLYNFNGISEEDNLIYFDLNSASLAAILSSLQPNIKSLKFKLDNGRRGARRFVLKILVEYPSVLENSQFINHDLWVSIMKRKYWSGFDDHDFGPYDISLNLPNVKQLHPITEKLALTTHYVSIAGKRLQDRKAFLTITSFCQARLSTKNKFTHLNLSEDEAADLPVNEQYKVRTDVRRLNQVFGAMTGIKQISGTVSIKDANIICFRFFNEFLNFKIMLPNYSD